MTSARSPLQASLKFDFMRLLLLSADTLTIAVSLFTAYSMVFEQGIPASFLIQGFHTLGLFLFGTFSVFAFARVFSRKIPNFNLRELQVLVLANGAVVGVVYFVQRELPVEIWPLVLLVVLVLFFARAAVGIWATYRLQKQNAITMWGMPILAAGFAVLLWRGHPATAQWPVPEADLPVSRTITVLYFFFSTIGFALVRSLQSWVFRRRRRGHSSMQRIILVGAGEAGLRFLRANEGRRTYEVLALLDEDPLRKGLLLNRWRIEGGLDCLSRLVRELRPDLVALASRRMPLARRRELSRMCRDLNIPLLLVQEDQAYADAARRIGSVAPSALLGRQEYEFLPQQDQNYLRDKVVLVTGAGGSIGSELCRQIARCAPASLILLGRGENAIFEIHRELQQDFSDVPLIPVVANVTHPARLQQIFARHTVQVVFHAAAHKHVPLMEGEIAEALENNALGTWNLAAQAGMAGVERFLLVSTDKAVNPKSTMGLSKWWAERVVRTAQGRYPQTQWKIVRFGNVLGSRGSVIPIFLQQIRQGGPLTLTHPEMTRYFMSIPEAVSLILKSAGMAGSGNTYVLDMGEPVAIRDLAWRMIESCGLVPEQDIPIRYVGIRPGEKLHEELVDTGQSLQNTPELKIQEACLPPETLNWDAIREEILREIG